MELFERNSKVCRFVTVNDDVIRVCLGYNTVAIQAQLTGRAPPIKEI
jgi:hypothetical protein